MTSQKIHYHAIEVPTLLVVAEVRPTGENEVQLEIVKIQDVPMVMLKPFPAERRRQHLARWLDSIIEGERLAGNKVVFGQRATAAREVLKAGGIEA